MQHTKLLAYGFKLRAWLSAGLTDWLTEWTNACYIMCFSFIFTYCLWAKICLQCSKNKTILNAANFIVFSFSIWMYWKTRYWIPLKRNLKITKWSINSSNMLVFFLLLKHIIHLQHCIWDSYFIWKHFCFFSSLTKRFVSKCVLHLYSYCFCFLLPLPKVCAT